MIRIRDIEFPLGYSEEQFDTVCAVRLGIDISDIVKVEILKKAVDTKSKDNIHFKISLGVRIIGDENDTVWKIHDKLLSVESENFYILPGNKKLNSRPIIVGSGPAGLFAALILAKAGTYPILIERGADVDSRKKSVSLFWNSGILDVNSNVQFGEGGAGTFSDGKLKIGMKDPRKAMILNELIDCGAHMEINFLDKPHIGTDKLHGIVKAIRNKIISLGGEVFFNTQMTEVLHHGGKVYGIKCKSFDKNLELYSDNIVLAIGNSARDTFEELYKNNIVLEQRPIAIGVRIEHSQQFINNLMYGRFAEDTNLGAADYKMVTHLKNGRSVYTFCMCPGGNVIAATSDEGSIVTNGMSCFDRSGKCANTAILVSLDSNDFKSDHPLEGIRFLKDIEEKAFIAGGQNYFAPVQKLSDFLNSVNSNDFGEVLPTYKPGTTFAKIDSYLPDYISESLRAGIADMEDWMPGYAFPDAILTGPETRSSSPVRIKRSDELQACGIDGLYPCGEGGGYSGGIISAAVDGVRCAEMILSK